MGIKENIRNTFFANNITKKFYEKIAWLKGWLYYAIFLSIPIIKHKVRYHKAVFLVFTPQHANLGDHAIAYAEKNILARLGIPFFEITGEQLRILDYYKMIGILDKSLILINGGGNIGTLWPNIEYLNRRIVIANPHATIMVLPNTMFFGTSLEEMKEYEISKEIYTSHPNLYFYARERITFEAMKNVFKNVKLVPDLVLSLDFTETKLERKGCIICLRSDIEATLSTKEKKHVEISSKKLFGENVVNSDTVLAYNVPVIDREKELLKKIREFCAAELVITDRLHGMIFCAITGTNCIVLNSKSPKICGCYEWIKHLNYIRLVENVHDIETVYSQMKSQKNIYEKLAIIELIGILEKDIMKMYEG